MDDTQEKGWALLRQLNSVIANEDPAVADPSTTARRILATYMRLPASRPSKLHSAFLAAAAKMSLKFPEFQLVPFIDMWGLENLRAEDSDPFVTTTGKRMPSTFEQLVKAYAHSLVFRPQQRLEKCMEDILVPVLERRGYVMSNLDGVHNTMLALRVFNTEKRGLHLTFVTLISYDGATATAEVHTITNHLHIRYADIPGTFFRVLLKRGDNGMRVVEAIKADSIPSLFGKEVGYVEHIDYEHDHIHIYDSHSRHFAATLTSKLPHIHVGQYVQFIPVIPKESTFKSAFIQDVFPYDDGPSAFGYREAQITYVDRDHGYAAWELCADNVVVEPIVELGTDEPSYTKGYIQGNLFNDYADRLEKGCKVRLITFLKRGKDAQKRPHVVDVLIVGDQR